MTLRRQAEPLAVRLLRDDFRSAARRHRGGRDVTASSASSRTERPQVVVVGGGFAGVNAAHALRSTDADVIPLDKHNYRCLQLPARPNVFVAGDLARLTAAPSGPLLPMLAAVAIQSGRYAGERVARTIIGKSLDEFDYHDKGMLAVLGRGDAVAELPLPLVTGSRDGCPLRFGGLLAWLLWAGVHIVYLIGFGNRIKVLIDWGWSYVTSHGAGAILVNPTEETHRPSHDRKAAPRGL